MMVLVSGEGFEFDKIIIKHRVRIYCDLEEDPSSIQPVVSVITT